MIHPFHLHPLLLILQMTHCFTFSNEDALDRQVFHPHKGARGCGSVEVGGCPSIRGSPVPSPASASVHVSSGTTLNSKVYKCQSLTGRRPRVRYLLQSAYNPCVLYMFESYFTLFYYYISPMHQVKVNLPFNHVNALLLIDCAQ